MSEPLCLQVLVISDASSVKLKHFSKFVDMTDALSAATAAVEGKMSKNLKKVLKKVFASDVQEQLAVADAKLGNVIKVTLPLPKILTGCGYCICFPCRRN